MAVLDIAGKIRGYVVISAEGYFTERFLNICMRRGIFLRNVKRLGETKLVACMGIQDFRNVRPIAAKTHTKVRIVKRCGLPFFLHRYRHRKAAIAGVLLFFAVLWYFSGHVTGIEISGNERIGNEAIVSELKEAGVYYGARVSKLDSKLIQNRMMTEMDGVAWVGVNIKGSRIYIEIKERLETRIDMEKNVPCNIVAAKDGVIRMMDVKNGQSMVKVGEMVEKGDLLVSGAVDSVSEGIRYVHAFGEVYAETLYRISEEYPLEYTEKIYSGVEKKRYSIKVLGKKAKLFFDGGTPFENCDKATEVKEYRMPLEFIPSVFVECDRYREYTPEKKARTEAETVAVAKQELCKKLNAEIPHGTEIKNINVTHNRSEKNKVIVTVEYFCRENIAMQTPIDKIENIDYDITETMP